MEFGEMNNVIAVVFESPFNSEHCFVCGVDDMDFIVWLTYKDGLHPYTDAKRATGVNLDGVEKEFYLVWVQDCMDPPVAIVRADNVSDAIDEFVEELTWAHLDELAAKDYIEEGTDGKDLKYSDSLGIGPSGQMYDSESLMVMDISGNIIIIR